MAALPSPSSSCNTYHDQPPQLLLPSLLSSLRLLLHLYLLVIVHVQPLTACLSPENPSTTWSWGGGTYIVHDDYKDYTYSNFTLCNNATKYPYPLNDEGLYGRCTDISSHHFGVLFLVCFVLKPSGKELVYLASDSGSYLSIVVLNDGTKVTCLSQAHVIWTANTEKPVSNNACLELGEDSNLKLVEYYDNIRSPDVVWETNTTGRAVHALLGFSFEGNLVLFTNTTHSPFVPLWQSHQHPTDTLMVLQVLHKRRTLSVRNSADSQPPKSGNYTMVIQNGCLVLYARIGQYDEQTPYGSPYWKWSKSASAIDRACAPAEDGISFVALCWDLENQLQLYAGYNRSEVGPEISPEDCSSMHHNGDLQPIIRIEDTNAGTNVTYSTFMRLDADGDLRAYTNEGLRVSDERGTITFSNSTTITYRTSDWSSFYSVFRNKPCQLPLYCGFYGKCREQQNKNHHCTCDTGFEFKDASNVRLGCKLKNDRNQREWKLPTNGTVCSSGKNETIDFITLQDVYYFSINFTDIHGYDKMSKESSGNSCQEKCRKDCNCTAAFWDGRASTCFLVRGQVGTIQNGTMVAYLKYVRPAGNFPWIVMVAVLATTTVAFALRRIYPYYRDHKSSTHSGSSKYNKKKKSMLASSSHMEIHGD